MVTFPLIILRFIRVSSPSTLNSFCAALFNSPNLSRTADTFFFFGGRAVFLNRAGIIQSFNAFFPGVHNRIVNVAGFDVAVQIIHQLNRNAGVNPLVNPRHYLNNQLLAEIAVFLIEPEFVLDKRRTVRHAALAVVLNKNLL